MFIGEKKQFIEKQIHSLSQINKLRKQLKDINVSLEKLYPITIVKDDIFFVFDLNETCERYEFVLEHKTPMHVQNGVLASYPLEFYNMKSSAIVSEEVFNTVEGYVNIFHEFVHCFQWESCEKEIRETLEIERISKENNNFMWEITHLFPYENPFFIQKSIEIENSLNFRDFLSVLNYHKEMYKHLNKID